MVKIFKPKFWDKGKFNFFSLMLFPFSLVTLLIIYFKKHFIIKKKFKIPIICIGNIYIGGTGKTPASIWLAQEISKLGFRTAILRKLYKNHYDEYNQIKNSYSNLIVNKNRIKGLTELENNGYDLAILDDGLQDYKIKKDLSIVCFNSNQLIGNGLVIPAGPLRESLKAIENSDLVLINGKKNEQFEKKLLKLNRKLKIFYSYYKPTNIEEFTNHNLLALAGIANPKNFFNLLEKNNLIIREKLIFPDHYKFDKSEIQNIIARAEKNNLKIVMTEKDFFKVNNYNLNNINYLKVSLEIPNKKDIINEIKKLSN